MPKGTRKRRWLAVIVAAAIGIGIGLFAGYALGRLHHRGEGLPKPLPVRIEPPERLNDLPR